MSKNLSFQPCPGVTVHQGDALSVLPGIGDGSIAAVITDPPYSSGGLMRSDRVGKTSAKYTRTGTACRLPEFGGDNRDQRSHLRWSVLWLSEALRVTREGGALMVFSDWRQLPLMSDAIQCAGWVWRGIIPWDKTEGCRPQMGWFRAQAEYILTATRGSMGHEQARAVRVCAPGAFRFNVQAHQKKHIAGKPVELMRALMQVVPSGGVILDPFAGSGSTLVAAADLRYSAIGVEAQPDYVRVIVDRLSRKA